MRLSQRAMKKINSNSNTNIYMYHVSCIMYIYMYKLYIYKFIKYKMKVHKRDSNEVLSRKVERNVSVILFFTCFCCLHFVQFLSFYIIALTIQSILPYSLLEVKSFPDFLHFPDKISSSGTKFFLICRILFDVRFKYFRMAHNFSFLKLHKLVIYMVHSKPDFIVVHYPITFLQNVSFCSTL